MKYLLLILGLTGLLACASGKQSTVSSTAPPVLLNEQTFQLTEVSSDRTYGYSQKNPVKVGGAKQSEGPMNERRYLNALAGPNGESIRYERLGSCCQFNTPNSFMSAGMLDKYKLEWRGMEGPVIVYLNMYDAGDLKAPAGLTIKQQF